MASSPSNGAVMVGLQNLSAKEAVWSAFIELGQEGRLWEEATMRNQAGRQAAKESFFDEWSVFNLATYVTTLRLFRGFADGRFCWKSASTFEVKAFLRSFRTAGPTVPKGRLAALQWLETYMGLKTHCRDKSVVKVAEPPADYLSEQAAPVAPRTLRIFIHMLKSTNDSIKTIGLWWCLAVMTALRPIHMSRTTVLRLGSRSEGKVLAGKHTIRGRQKPFYWSSGHIYLGSIDIWEILAPILSIARLGTETNPGMIPVIVPKRATLDKAQGSGLR